MLTYYTSPVGILKLEARDDAILRLDFTDLVNSVSGEPLSPILQACVTQLDEYFAGRRKVFDIALSPAGTDFKLRAWSALRRIPYGETRSYKDIASIIGQPKAVRAVGGANHHNPISIIIPCHRVIGADGSLTGYGGGLERKEWLLAHERRNK